MREIKFRVIINGVKYYWGWINNNFISLPIVSTLGNDDIIKLSCQFIGLKDENEKEIYEGDIVKSNWLDDKQRITNAKIIFSAGRFTCLGLKSNLYEMPELEVIGNIYENPELLKQ